MIALDLSGRSGCPEGGVCSRKVSLYTNPSVGRFMIPQNVLYVSMQAMRTFIPCAAKHKGQILLTTKKREYERNMATITVSQDA
jgi:hypothetical protein